MFNKKIEKSYNNIKSFADSGVKKPKLFFIEPKGKHLKPHDKWKEDLLEEIKKNGKILEINTDKYLITGVPFYNNENENKFKDALEKVLL